MNDTKRRILDAAERLFAEKGFHGTSLRDITAAARVNLAAVNYHFGSKEALLASVLERRIAPVNTMRLELLDIAERQAEDAPTLDAVLRALLVPPFELMQGWNEQGAKFMQLAGRMHSETHDSLRELFFQHFKPVQSRFLAALRGALPELSLHELQWRMEFVIGAMAHALVWGATSGSNGGRRVESETVLENLIQFCEAGMRAPAEAPVFVTLGATA